MSLARSASVPLPASSSVLEFTTLDGAVLQCIEVVSD